MNYNSDNLAVPIRELDKVLEAVKRGSFDPDAKRSQRFPASWKPVSDKFRETTGYSVKEFAVSLAGEARVALVFNTVEMDAPTQPGIAVIAENSDEEASSEEEEEEDMSHFLDEDEPLLHLRGQLDDDDADEDQLIAKVRGEDQDEVMPAAMADVDLLYRRVDRRTVHFGHKLDPLDKLACGKSMTANYAVESKTRFDQLFPKCKNCFGLKG